LIRGSSRWDRSLIPELEALERAVSAGTTDAKTLQRYYRTSAAYYAGGFAALDAAHKSRLSRLIAQFETRPPDQSLAAYRRLIAANGGRVHVAYDVGSGEVLSILLNAAYRVPDERSGKKLHALLTRGDIADVLGLGGRDVLRLHGQEDLPAGRWVEFYRLRDGVEVGPDKVSVLLRRAANEFTVRSILSYLGPVGQASCSGADPSIFKRYDLSGDKSFSRLYSQRVLARPEGEYRCIFQWYGSWNDPGGDGKYPYYRAVDAITGKVYADGVLELEAHRDDDVHYARVPVTVPYRTNAQVSGSGFFAHPTMVPGGKICIYRQPPPDPGEYQLDAEQTRASVPGSTSSIPGVMASRSWISAPWSRRMAMYRVIIDIGSTLYPGSTSRTSLVSTCRTARTSSSRSVSPVSYPVRCPPLTRSGSSK
jgi:hypothetical protein